MIAQRKGPMGDHLFGDMIDLGVKMGLDHPVSLSFWFLHQVFASILGVNMNFV
jgi:hypothetical protein